MPTSNNRISSPFGELNFIGHLLSRFYPTTSIYSNNLNTPVIVEWIDENEQGSDEFFIYESSVNCLKDYIQGNITHLDLIAKASREQYYKFQGSINTARFNDSQLNSIGKKNLPSRYSFFKRSESLDVETIESKFKITEFEVSNEEYFGELKTHSEERQSGLFRLHLRNGTNVTHGVADTKIIGEILVNFEQLYNEVARDFFGTLEGYTDARVTEQDERDFILSSHTEIVLNEAASFSVYLKSKRDFQYSDSDEVSHSLSDIIFGKLNDVIQKSSDINSLSTIKNNFSRSVFGKVQTFAETIFVHKIALDMEYYNSTSQYTSRKTVLPSKAHGIYMSVQNTSFQDVIRHEFSGKFVLINTDTGHFTFRQTGSTQNFSGYFSRLLYDNISSFNFRNKYNVVIEQTKIDNVGKKRVKLVNKLVSCTLHNQPSS